MFAIREVLEEDLDSLCDVASHLDTVNLPAERTILQGLVKKSCDSFAGLLPPFERLYILVLVELARRRVVGTSMIQAQHGTRRAPHILFDVLEDERYHA